MNNMGVNQYTNARRRSPKAIIWSWIGVLASLLFLIPTGAMLMASIESLRPCSVNSSGLSIASCGRAAPSVTDFIVAGIFVGAIIIVICALTHAIRVTRKQV